MKKPVVSGNSKGDKRLRQIWIATAVTLLTAFVALGQACVHPSPPIQATAPGTAPPPMLLQVLERAAAAIAESLPAESRIAITSMVDHSRLGREYRYRTELDVEHSFAMHHYRRIFGPIALVRGAAEDFLVGELEHILAQQGFAMVANDLAETHIAERRYWGLEWDAGVAARIGHFAEATVVIIVGTDGAAALRRLRLRAVDTATMRVIATVSERL